LLYEQPFCSAHSIAEALCFFHSTILNNLRESLGMTILHSRWIPHELTTILRQIPMETCRESLPILKAHEKNKFQRFVAGDESQFTLEFHDSTKWSVSRDNVPRKAKQQIETQKFMLTVIWGIDGFHVVDLMTEQHSEKTQYFLSHTLEPLLLAVFTNGRKPHSTSHPLLKGL
jgi:hypothetical protein